jgi:hypothetical protein
MIAYARYMECAARGNWSWSCAGDQCNGACLACAVARQLQACPSANRRILILARLETETTPTHGAVVRACALPGVGPAAVRCFVRERASSSLDKALGT